MIWSVVDLNKWINNGCNKKNVLLIDKLDLSNNKLHPFTKKWDTLIIYFFLKNYLLLRINN
jgi:hypothetical protein